MEELLRGFEEVYTHITVVAEYVSTQEMRDSLLDQAAAGLGPDLIIESDLAIVADLHDAGLLVDLSQEEVDTSELLAHAVNSLRLDNGLFGIPFAAHTNILYFNKELVPNPPASLKDFSQLWPIEDIQPFSAETRTPK